MGRQKLLILGHTWPEPKATAAGVRMLQLIDFFKDSDWELTFATTSVKPTHTIDLETFGIAFQAVQVNDDQFDAFLAKYQPDMVLFDRYITEEQFGWRVAETVPHCIRVLDTEDLHSLRLARKAAVEQEKSFEIKDWLGLDQTKRELASIYRSDLSLIISRYEMKLLREEIGLPAALLHYYPFTIDNDLESQSKLPGYHSRKDFIFIGGGRHQPNLDAIKLLKKVIWPGIRESLPAASLNIYGAYLPDTILSLTNPEEGFFIMGYVEDAEEAMRGSKVNLAPLTYGAGLKGKLLMAMEQGTPSVCTAIAAEGFLDIGSSEAYIFDEPAAFANEAVRLYTSEEDWKQMQELGFKTLAAEFNSKVHIEALSKTLNNLGNELSEHRSRNFFGAMLHHHSMQSTKYLSKWITLKNELKTRDQES